MLQKITCSGIGGQGVLTLGTILAETAAALGLFATWLPEYEGAMRGGASASKVKISDEKIISPFMEEIDILVALNEASLQLYGEQVVENGYIIIEEELVPDVPKYQNKKVVKIPAIKLVADIGNPKGMSVAVAGAIVACADLFPYDTALEAVGAYFESKHLPVDENKAAFAAGYRFVKEAS